MLDSQEQQRSITSFTGADENEEGIPGGGNSLNEGMETRQERRVQLDKKTRKREKLSWNCTVKSLDCQDKVFKPTFLFLFF